MILDIFNIEVFNLLEDIVYIYDYKTLGIIFINKRGKNIIGDIPELSFNQIKKNGFFKCVNLENNKVITDDEYIFYNNRKYLSTRTLSVYENRKVVICICKDLTDRYEEQNNTLEMNDILIESIKYLRTEDEIFEAIYKIINMIGIFYNANSVNLYDMTTDNFGRGLLYQWEKGAEKQFCKIDEGIQLEIENWRKYKGFKEIFFIEDISILKGDLPEKYKELKTKNVNNILIIIMKLSDKPDGIMFIENLRKPDKDFSVLNTLLYFILNEIKIRETYKKLNDNNYQDFFTELNNRNKYINYIENIKYSTLKSVGVVFIDVNGLKTINDKFGKEFGNKVILEIGNSLKKYFRKSDCYRIGGDEFLIICENINKNTFYEKINAINQYFLDIKEYSVSIGYIWRDDNINIFELTYKAEYYMYHAKRKYYSIINKENIEIYSAMATESEDDSNEINFVVGYDNSLDFINSGISFKTKYEIFKIKVSQIGSNPKYNNFIMVMLDINNFKAINEIYGFNKGNKILLTINSIINKHILGRGTCCHFHSDVFYFFMESNSDVETLKTLNFIDEEIHNKNSDTKVSISYGIYRVEEKNKSVEECIERASYAHKMAKKEDIKHIIFYDDRIKEVMLNEKQIEDEMEEALKNNEFKLYFQPKYEIYTEEIVGAEALVRWKHPEKGILTPGKFINIFEKNAFIMKLDLYILEQTCKFIKKNVDLNRKNLPISVNMSKLNFKKHDFKKDVLNILNKYSIDPMLIEFEITESLIMENPDRTINILNEFKKEGLKISIDDFGSGYSGLNILQMIPLDTLKIDCVFFKNFDKSNKGAIIIKNIVSLAKELNLNIVAEGVELQEEIDYLREIGCNIVQGYYFSKPVNLKDFEKMVY